MTVEKLRWAVSDYLRSNPATFLVFDDAHQLDPKGLEVEAGDRGDYFDLTPVLIMAATGFVMLRFFAVGTDSKLLYAFHPRFTRDRIGGLWVSL